MDDTSGLDLSIVIPVYNERDNLVPLEEKLEEELSKLELSYEIILVDDGSVDGSPHIIKSIQKSTKLTEIYQKFVSFISPRDRWAL